MSPTEGYPGLTSASKSAFEATSFSALWLGSDFNFPLWVQKDARFHQTERRDSLARKKASSIPLRKHQNKNNHHHHPVPSSSPTGTELERAQKPLVWFSPGVPHPRVSKSTCSRRKPPGTFKRAPCLLGRGRSEGARKTARSFWARLGRKTLRSAGQRRRLGLQRPRGGGTAPRRHAVPGAARKGRPLLRQHTDSPTVLQSPTPRLLRAHFLSQEGPSSPDRSAPSLWTHNHPPPKSSPV